MQKKESLKILKQKSKKKGRRRK